MSVGSKPDTVKWFMSKITAVITDRSSFGFLVLHLDRCKVKTPDSSILLHKSINLIGSRLL